MANQIVGIEVDSDLLTLLRSSVGDERALAELTEACHQCLTKHLRAADDRDVSTRRQDALRETRASCTHYFIGTAAGVRVYRHITTGEIELMWSDIANLYGSKNSSVDGEKYAEPRSVLTTDTRGNPVYRRVVLATVANAQAGVQDRRRPPAVIARAMDAINTCVLRSVVLENQNLKSVLQDFR